MSRCLEHRGPDGAGVVASEAAVLAVRRLAVRGELAARQPIRDPETGIVVVCNGEIDNHKELRAFLEARGYAIPSTSDVDVLPSLYLELGPSFLAHLDGPFALAVWDPRTAALLLARDRVGERPLFYMMRNGNLAFATELSALAAELPSAEEHDPAALAHYLRFGYFPAPQSPVQAIRKVAPAEVLQFDTNGNVRRHRYWHWRLGEVAPRRPQLAEFDRIFQQTIRRQCACDVEFGVFLSGGVDSSLVAAVATHLHPGRRLRAYTLRFAEDSYDEGPAAAEMVSRLGMIGHEVWVKPGDFPKKIRDLVRLVGEPLGDPAWVPSSMLAERAAKDVKVVLVGEGGDEVFGGNPTYPGALLAGRYARLPAVVRRGIAQLVKRLPVSDKKVTVSYLLKRFVEGDGMDAMSRHRLWTSTIPPRILKRLGVSSGPSEWPVSKTADTLGLLQRHDLETSLAEGLLTKADRATMGWAVEARAPFLDRTVLEFAATLPPRERVRGLQTKTFLKRYASRYLPHSIVHRKKRGLSVPLGAWLRGPLEAWARRRLNGGYLDAVGLSDAAALSLLEEHLGRRADHARTLWTLLTLCEWIEWWHEARQPRDWFHKTEHPAAGTRKASL